MKKDGWKRAACGFLLLTIGLASSAAHRNDDWARKGKKAAVSEVRAAHPNPSAAGGPDAFGYRYEDSNEPGGPAFNWVDISGTGTPVSFLDGCDDDYAFPLEIGFPFSFYGQTFTQAAVGTNGHLYFQDEYLGLGNTCIPGETGYAVTENFIAAYWTDLYPCTGAVYAETLGSPGSRRFVVQFDGVDFYDCAESGWGLSFQIILNEADNSILLQYLRAGYGCMGEDYGGFATVGIQRDPSLGLQYSCEEPVLEDNLAILFHLEEPFTPDVTFLDDAGRSELCVQRSNGRYQWTNRDGSVYTGTLVVANGGTAFWTTPEDPTYIFATYDVRRKRARGYFTNSEDGSYNSLSDRNTTNNPPCGSLVLPGAPSR